LDNDWGFFQILKKGWNESWRFSCKIKIEQHWFIHSKTTSMRPEQYQGHGGVTCSDFLGKVLPFCKNIWKNVIFDHKFLVYEENHP
jgi:hypothetical protein